MTTDQSQFVSTRNKGYQMTFQNGITISVQFGTGNYCDRRNSAYDRLTDDTASAIVESKSAEIAIWDKNGTWFDFGHDKVKGWVSADEVAKWMILCASSTSIEDLQITASQL